MHAGASEWAQKNTEKSKNRFINDAFVHVHNLMANEFSRSFFLFFFFRSFSPSIFNANMKITVNLWIEQNNKKKSEKILFFSEKIVFFVESI